MARTVIFYETESGAVPVEKFLNKLSANVQDKVFAAVRHVQEDNLIPPTLFCKMVNTDDLWEIRVK